MGVTHKKIVASHWDRNMQFSVAGPFRSALNWSKFDFVHIVKPSSHLYSMCWIWTVSIWLTSIVSRTTAQPLVTNEALVYFVFAAFWRNKVEYISTCRHDSNEIPTATPMFLGSSNPIWLRLCDLIGSWKSKMAAYKPDVLISQLVDKSWITLNCLIYVFEVELFIMTIGNVVRRNLK